MQDDNIGLSRRKVLVGLGAVGVASAGAGLGTTAYFSDEESFVGNSLTAGELDLFVHVDYSEDQGDYAQYAIDTILNGNTVGADVRGEPLHIEVDDLKPGDSGEGQLCFSIVDNDAYMWMCGELTANDQNGTTEPEEATLMDMFGEIPDDGQLADAMEVTVSYCDEEGEHLAEIVTGSLREVMAALQTGVPLYGDGNPDAPVSNRPAFEGVESHEETAETCVCFEWEVPTTVGNEIQTDSVEFDFSFYAEQKRHNDGTDNPCVAEMYSSSSNPSASVETEDVLQLSTSHGSKYHVFAMDLEEPWSDEAEPHANGGLGFDMDENGVWDWQVHWSSADGFRYQENLGSPGSPDIQSWESLPADMLAVKNGTQIIFALPSNRFPAVGETYSFVANASYGGPTHANISTDPESAWSSNDGWTSSEYFLQTTVA